MAQSFFVYQYFSGHDDRLYLDVSPGNKNVFAFSILRSVLKLLNNYD